MLPVVPAAPPFTPSCSQAEYLTGLRAMLQEVVREEVRLALREELSACGAAPAEKPKPALPALLSVKEAAAFLNVCAASIHSWKRRGVLPYHKLGRRTMFSVEDLLAAVQQPPSFDGRRATPRRGRRASQ